MARLKFLGAVEGVTGSCYLLSTENAQIVLECGLFQGHKEVEAANFEPLPLEFETIDAVVLSHAHLDHSGRLPLVVSQGLNCPIYMTWPTCDLIEVLLKDAASLQERDAEWKNKHRKRSGKEEAQPLYRLEDVEQTLSYLQGVNYHQRINIADGIEIRYRDAGHILGSAIVEVFIQEGSREKKLVFSGDLGNSQAALLKDPDRVESADILLLESTYGDRDHRSMEETLKEFEEIIEDASLNGGNILIPAFAVGRTQEIIFRLGELYQKGKLRHQVVYLDSPMAIAVTEIYHRYQNYYSSEDKAVLKSKNNQKSLHSFLPILRYSTTTAESIALNNIDSGAIIIAGSGMCNGGRIRHHLKHNLWRRQSHVVFVGFQAEGTPGRALIDGVERFRVAGEEVIVNANIHTSGGFSAHAGQSQLIDWVEGFTQKKPRIFLVHGEENAKNSLQAALKAKGWSSEIPLLNDSITF